MRLGRERLENVVLAIEYVADAGKSGLNHRGGSHAIARAHPGEIERLFHVLVVRRPAP